MRQKRRRAEIQTPSISWYDSLEKSGPVNERSPFSVIVCDYFGTVTCHEPNSHVDFNKYIILQEGGGGNILLANIIENKLMMTNDISIRREKKFII